MKKNIISIFRISHASNCNSNPVFLVDGATVDNSLILSWTLFGGAAIEVSPYAMYSNKEVWISVY